MVSSKQNKTSKSEDCKSGTPRMQARMQARMQECAPQQDSRQYEIFPDRLYLRRVEPAKNMHRYYFMTVQCDLFGGASLIREWGRIGSTGQVRVDYFNDEGQAVDALAQIMEVKRKRGYEM